MARSTIFLVCSCSVSVELASFEARHLDFGADQKAYGGDQSNFAAAVHVMIAMLQVDDADERPGIRGTDRKAS